MCQLHSRPQTCCLSWLLSTCLSVSLMHFTWMSVSLMLSTCLSVSLMHCTWLSVCPGYLSPGCMSPGCSLSSSLTLSLGIREFADRRLGACLYMLVTCKACELATYLLAVCRFVVCPLHGHPEACCLSSGCLSWLISTCLSVS